MIIFYQILQRVDHNTDIVYTLCTTIGPVSPRLVSHQSLILLLLLLLLLLFVCLFVYSDFVTVRRWGLIQGAYYSANVSTTHSSRPPQRDPIRYKQ